jgi:hypothetical protein
MLTHCRLLSHLGLSDNDIRDHGVGWLATWPRGGHSTIWNSGAAAMSSAVYPRTRTQPYHSSRIGANRTSVAAVPDVVSSESARQSDCSIS